MCAARMDFPTVFINVSASSFDLDQREVILQRLNPKWFANSLNSDTLNGGLFSVLTTSVIPNNAHTLSSLGNTAFADMFDRISTTGYCE